MNDILELLGTARSMALVYLWVMFIGSAALLVADVLKRRHLRRVDHVEPRRHRKAA